MQYRIWRQPLLGTLKLGTHRPAQPVIKAVPKIPGSARTLTHTGPQIAKKSDYAQFSAKWKGKPFFYRGGTAFIDCVTNTNPEQSWGAGYGGLGGAHPGIGFNFTPGQRNVLTVPIDPRFPSYISQFGRQDHLEIANTDPIGYIYELHIRYIGGAPMQRVHWLQDALGHILYLPCPFHTGFARTRLLWFTQHP